MPNLTLPTDITPGVTPTFESDVEAAWKELNSLSRDTGVRVVTPSLLNGWTAGAVYLSRVRDRVYWEFYNLNGAAATATTLFDVTAFPGFAPHGAAASPLYPASTAGQSGHFRASSNYLMSQVGFVSLASSSLLFDYRTRAAWPSTLPGTAL